MNCGSSVLSEVVTRKESPLIAKTGDCLSPLPLVVLTTFAPGHAASGPGAIVSGVDASRAVVSGAVASEVVVSDALASDLVSSGVVVSATVVSSIVVSCAPVGPIRTNKQKTQHAAIRKSVPARFIDPPHLIDGDILHVLGVT